MRINISTCIALLTPSFFLVSLGLAAFFASGGKIGKSSAWGATRTSLLANALGDSTTRQRLAVQMAAQQGKLGRIPGKQILQWTGAAQINHGISSAA